MIASITRSNGMKSESMALTLLVLAVCMVFASPWDNNNLWHEYHSSSSNSILSSSAGFTSISSNNSNSISSISNSNNNSSRRLLSNTATDRPTVTIYVYDKIKGYMNWQQPWFIKAARDKCATKCIMTEDQSSFAKADLVLFHAPTHTGMMPGRAKPNSNGNGKGSEKGSGKGGGKRPIYALLSLEQPRYATMLQDKTLLAQKFDLLVTYSLAPTYPGTTIPNLPVTYYPLHILSPSSVLQPPRPYKDKDGYGTGVSVVLFTSNCHNAGASKRFQYVEELMRHIDVHR